MQNNWKRDNFTITTDQNMFDMNVIHGYLTRSYWAEGVTFDRVKKSVENSLGFGLFCEDTMIGYARIITDYSRLSYLCDVFVLEEYRGRGLSKWLMEIIVDYEPIIETSILLATKDAEKLYAKYGFEIKNDQTFYMQLKRKPVQ